MYKAISPVMVFGLSSEGYQIASELASKKVSVTIVDERLQRGIELRPEVIASHPTAEALAKSRTLQEGLEVSATKAKYIFFAPRVRKDVEDVKAELSLKLKDVARFISEGSTLIFALPLGLGDNQENIQLIERLSGLKVGDEVDYVYAPLPPKRKAPAALGLASPDGRRALGDLFNALEARVPATLPLKGAELFYLRQVTSKYQMFASELELYRNLESAERLKLKRLSDYCEVYLDGMVDYLLDLQMLTRTLRSGEPMFYLASGLIKSVKHYTRYLIDEVMALLKRGGLKASKTKVVVAWSVDPYEMRGDRISTLLNLVSRLRDYVSDVVAFPVLEAPSTMRDVSILSPDKANILVACSEKDFRTLAKGLEGNQGERDMALVKANLLCEVV